MQNDHIDAGLHGTKFLFHALAENGRTDLTWRMLTQKTLPGYGHWVEQGASTLYEAWDCSGSLNHIGFGDISSWFYKVLAGINIAADQPAFKHIIIHPRPVGDLKWVKAEHESMYGLIKSEWQLADGGLHLKIIIPVNTTATVSVSINDEDHAANSVSSVKASIGATLVGVKDGAAVYEVGSGSYSFINSDHMKDLRG